jgi:predicted ATPase/DNA-binding winged helix-turn-helix (wHTH) protein
MTKQTSEAKLLRFDGWELRPIERRLTVRGAPAQIGSRAFDVLLALIDRTGVVVRRDDLLDAAWPGLVVEENNLSVQIAALRKVLGPRVIATIPGIGYRFSATPEEVPLASTAPNPIAAAPQSHLIDGNLPAVLSELIGREDDISELAALVRQHRVVSTVGAGGIGKTRLALAVAQRMRDEYQGGVWLVELAPLGDASLLPSAVAQALGIRLPGQKPTQDELFEALGGSTILLVLDNCEHIVDAASAFVRALVEATRATSVLATSQELLKIPEENVYRVAPLSVPLNGDLSAVTDHGALKLLETRVRALDRRFKIDVHNAADAVEVCRRLDGLPLAIELAAARVPLLGLSGVRERLDERFRMLVGGARAGLLRHRTLRETLAWSHALLSKGECAIFRRAGVFAGGFSIHLAQRVLGDADTDDWSVLELLGGLVDKSLVVVDATDPPRYRLLESARVYATEMLHDSGETQETRLKHAQAMKEHFESAGQLQWHLPSQVRLERFLPELDNARAALDWAGHADVQLYASLSGALAWLFGYSGQGVEGQIHCRRALELIDTDTCPLLRAKLLYELSGLLHDSAGNEKLVTAQSAVDLLRVAGDRAMHFSALGRLAISAALCDDRIVGDMAVKEMSAMWDPDWPALAHWELLNARDFVANLFGRLEEGEALAHEQRELAAEIGDSFKTLFAMMALEQCAATRHNYVEAVARGRELVHIARRERYVEKLHVYVANLATALIMANQVEEALPLAREAAAMDMRHGSLWQSLDMLAMLALKRGRPVDAAIVLGRADAANAWRGGDFREPVEREVRNQLQLALRQDLPKAELDQLLDRGAALTDDAAAQIALAD